jgi:hypothetical protein
MPRGLKFDNLSFDISDLPRKNNVVPPGDTYQVSKLSPILMTMFQRTSESWAWARESAHSRR